METTFVIYNEKKFKINLHETYSEVDSSDVLKYVGLPGLIPQECIYEINGLFGSDRTKAIRYIAYLHDIPFKKARKKYLSFLLVDMGIRLTWAKLDTDRFDCMKVGKDYIEWILNLDNISTKKMVKMINKEGFNVKYDKMDTMQKYNEYYQIDDQDQTESGN